MTAVFSLPPLVDSAHPAMKPAATLHTPIAYEILAPLSDTLDTISLFSPAQCWITYASAALVFLFLRLRGHRKARKDFSLTETARVLLVFTGGALAVVGIALVAWRPMAAIELADPNQIAIDFHSHTSASHDGRPGFDAERNREWHSSAGFNVAYVTDHRTFAGALEARLRNPLRAGDRTTLLPGVELRDGDEHPILIGVDPERMRITSADWQRAAVAADGGPAPPILLLTLPGDVARIPRDETDARIRLGGIEISDGSPRGMAQAQHEARAIIGISQRLRLALVTGSDNHGWGRTAPAWSVMQLPGWRRMTPAQLDVAIRHAIIARGPLAIDVIARRTATSPASFLDGLTSGVAIPLAMLRTLSPVERMSWLTWTWGLYALSLLAGANRRKARVRASRRRRRRAPSPVEEAA